MEIILWLGFTTTRVTMLKGHSIRKVKNHCPRWRCSQYFIASGRLRTTALDKDAHRFPSSRKMWRKSRQKCRNKTGSQKRNVEAKKNAVTRMIFSLEGFKTRSEQTNEAWVTLRMKWQDIILGGSKEVSIAYGRSSVRQTITHIIGDSEIKEQRQHMKNTVAGKTIKFDE